jgi:hypothetical protein
VFGAEPLDVVSERLSRDPAARADAYGMKFIGSDQFVRL